MLLIRWIVLSFCILFTFTFTLKANECQPEDPDVSDIKEISCAITDLWMAMANENLSKVIANSNFFIEYQEGDIVRTETVALQLENEITNTHQQYQMENNAKTDYTFSVTTYPAEVKEGTCRGNSTIQKRELSNTSQLVQESDSQVSAAQTANGYPPVFADYSPIEGKEPRYFQLRKKQNGKLVICEKSALSHSERISLFCGDDQKCVESLPASCDQLDQGQDNTSACVFMDETKSVIKDFLGAKVGARTNISMEYKFCPEDCSFYTQTLQKMRKIEGTDQYCTENYLIVHCGSKADSPPLITGGIMRRKFNLNIREVDDFCEDFNVVCQRVDHAEEELSEDLIDDVPSEAAIVVPADDLDESVSEETEEEASELPAEEKLPEETSEEEAVSEETLPEDFSEEETSAQPIDEILEEKPDRDNWFIEFFRLLRGKKQE